MASIIKATDRQRGVAGVAFNFDDMTSKANQYLGGVRAEAARILADANREAEAVRKKALEESHRAGFEAGQREGLGQIDRMIEEKLGAQLASLLPALTKAVRDVQDAKQAWLAHWERSAVHVAAAIAQRVIRRELAKAPDVPLTLVREALELAAGSARVRVCLNPEDHHSLAPQAEALAQELAGLGACELIADPQVAPGGCRVETDFGVIDQQIETQLARIEEELT